MVCSLPVALVLVVLKEREVDDPAECEARSDELEVLAQLASDCTGTGAALLPGLMGDHEDDIAFLGSEECAELLLQSHEELCGATRESAVGADLEERNELCPIDLGGLSDLIQIFSGEVETFCLGSDEGLYAALCSQNLLVCFKGGLRDNISDVLDLALEPEIRLVAAVCVHCIVVIDSPEVCGKLIVHHTLEDIAEKLLHEAENIITLYETHLEVQLSELELSVSSGVLVAVAAGNLEILVETADHKQLFVELRALRQSIELSGILSGRHEEVSCAFRRGPDESRGLDLIEALVAQIIADGLDELMSQGNALLHAAAAQIEEAVLEPEVLVDDLVSVNHERKCRTA